MNNCNWGIFFRSPVLLQRSEIPLKIINKRLQVKLFVKKTTEIRKLYYLPSFPQNQSIDRSSKSREGREQWQLTTKTIWRMRRIPAPSTRTTSPSSKPMYVWNLHSSSSSSSKTLISYSLPPFPDLLTFIMLRCFPILLFFKLSSLLLSCRVWDLIPQVLKKWRRK